MKKLSLVVILVGYSFGSSAQEFSRTFSSAGQPYVLSVSVMPDGSTKATVDKADGTKLSSFTFNPFTYDQFKNWLAPQLKTLAELSPMAANAGVDSDVMGLFYDSVARLMNASDDDGPVAGTLIIKPTVLIGTESDHDKKHHRWVNKAGLTSGDVLNVQVEVMEGFLENATAIIDYQNENRVFTNAFGIGFASKNNMNDLYKYWLIEKNKPSDQALRLNLGELFRFDIHNEPGRRDYSPKDGRYAYLLTREPVSAELRKDPVKRLIEARVYSDFVGLNQDNPNGLVQTEIFKRINTNTNRSLAFQKKTWINEFCRFVLGQGVGMLQYVVPTLTLSKFEENNRRLLVNRSQDTVALVNQKQSFTRIQEGKTVLRDSVMQVTSVGGRPAVTALDLLRYQNFSAGLDFNLLYTENIGGKFNFYLDGGIRFGRTALRDSTNEISSTTSTIALSKNEIKKTGFATDFGVNTFQIYPELKMQWLPEERFGVTLSRRWTYLSLRNGDYAQGSLRLGSYDYRDNNLPLMPERSRHWLGTWELFAFLKPSENGKLFFRYRLTNEIGNRSYNFNQAQVGYSFSILGNRQTRSSREGSE